MVPRLVKAKYSVEYRVWLQFEDGSQGEVDLKDELWGAIFEPLQKKEFFKTVRLDPDLNTITWDNGADFSPEFLYQLVQSQASC